MPRYSTPHLLSELGSDRATAYPWSNKIVTAEGKTHVVWTDTIALTRGRTFDHATRTWGPTHAIGQGVDNHNNPALTLDREGRLHVIYGPHGAHGRYEDAWTDGAFKWHAAPNPGGFEGMAAKTERVGNLGTYASIVNTPEGLDCIVYRGGEHPPMLMFQKQRPQPTPGGWTQAQPLMCQEIAPGYTHTGPQIFCSPDGTLYVTGHFYAMYREGSLGVTILRSTDHGRTWTDLTGRAVETPILYSEQTAVPHPAPALDPRNWGAAVDSRGQVWAATGSTRRAGRGALVSRWTGAGWETHDIGKHLPAGRSPVDGGFTIDTRDRLHVALTAVDENPRGTPDKPWSCPTSEVFHLCSEDGGKNWECGQVSPSDLEVANWLPSISRPGPFHPVEQVAILYTHGRSGLKPEEGCKSTTITSVHCVFVEG
ncbi:MAG: BNR-4 repeat-containing protein [Planctomycetota bacterium]|nr:BNR-4 repeat-containing protein [Planctomycetota bacterium]